MISLNDFQFSSFERKCDLVTEQADYLMQRKLGNCTIYLYVAGTFFIEVYYSTAYKKVLLINAFNELSGLNAYVDHISISDLTLSH